MHLAAVIYSLTEIETETENITYSLTETEIKTKIIYKTKTIINDAKTK